jgi:hypothetical protein
MADMQSVSVRIAALLLVAAGCGDDAHDSRATATPVLSAEQLTGVYDSNRGLVLVTGTNRNVRIDLGLVPESSISVQGTLRDDGSIELTGTASHQDMGISPVTGRVVVTRSPTEIRIAGALGNAQFGASPFDAFRPVAGTPPDLGGRFAFEFAESLSGRPITGDAVLAIEVPEDGRGRLVGDADETDGTGTRLGTLSAGTCLVSAGGDFQCRAPYRGAGGHLGPFGGPSKYDAVIGGVLPMPEIGFTGAGNVIVTNQAPITSHAFPYTTWTAIGAPPTP